MFSVLVGALSCKSNKTQTETPLSNKEKARTPYQVQPNNINPDNCYLVIRVDQIEDTFLKGTITEIIARGFGFKDFINVGDIREFKVNEEVDGLRVGSILRGTMRSIENSRSRTYTLKDISFIDR